LPTTMNNTDWVLIDTETTGLSSPVFVVELAAQRMRGWEPQGVPFRRLLNQNAEIPSEASRVHGYTREILERDGDPAAAVYRDFSLYVGGRPIVSYNLDYDLEEVLRPEWLRLGIEPIGGSGFCALRLAQRLLDPVPAGNCKLQTLRQFYRLPERGAHTALGDVLTVSDLMVHVLRPIAARRGVQSWSDVCTYTKVEWFPSRIAFGKFKGREFRDARRDNPLHDWLIWLAGSSNARSASMGRWYLERLKDVEREDEDVLSLSQAAVELDAQRREGPFEAAAAIVVYVHPEIAPLRNMVAAARSRLAEIETNYTRDHCAVEATQAKLFNMVRQHYQRRDRLRLIVDHRRKFLKVLLASGDEAAARVADEYEKARARSDTNYEDAARAATNKKELSSEEESEIRMLWKKLVRLYHPDRFAGEANTVDTYEKLTSAINRAREEGDIELLREIANDPTGFILRQGWTRLDFSDATEIESLRKLLDTLHAEIIDKLEALNNLHESSEYELHQRSSRQPALLDGVGADLANAISAEIARLETEAEKLKSEIAELVGAEETPLF
jgi:DNA polymerase III epsilon subunit-like protein